MNPGDAVRCSYFKGVACRVVEWEALYDDDTGELDVSSTHVYIRMVGDDRRHRVPVSTLTPISDDEFCGSCGQMGCSHGRF